MRRTKSELEKLLSAATDILKERIRNKESLTPEEDTALRAFLNKCVNLEHTVVILFPRHRLRLILDGNTLEEREQHFMAFVEELHLSISENNHSEEDNVTYEFAHWFGKIFVCNLPQEVEDELLAKMVKRKYKDRMSNY